MVAFGNATGMPLALLPAILAEQPELGSLPHAAFCVTIYGVTNKIGIWSFGLDMLSRSKLDDTAKGPAPSLLKKIFLEPVNIAAALGLVIGVTPVKGFFKTGAPLAFLMEGAKQLGQACFPLMTLILGMNLAGGANSARVDSLSLVVVTLVRLVVMPALCFGLHRLAAGQGLLPPDPMIQFVMLLEGAVPSAMQLAMVAKGTETIKAVGTFLFWQYLFGVLTMAGYIALFLNEVKNLQ